MSFDSISIRLATSDDAETIADLSRKTFYDTFAPFNTPEDMAMFLREQFTRDNLIAEVKNSANIFYIAYDGDELAGYVKLREHQNSRGPTGRNSLEIARIYATMDKIGKGVGRKLMQLSIDLAREKKKELIWLAVWEKNQRAIDFYSRWGFEIFDRQVFVLGSDLQRDWVMKKML
jgi:ribosomal protein S18 acetylase RimI-like enzyme